MQQLHPPAFPQASRCNYITLSKLVGRRRLTYMRCAVVHEADSTRFRISQSDSELTVALLLGLPTTGLQLW